MRKETGRQVKSIVTVLFVLAASLAANGALIAHDNFDYTPGTTIAAGGTLGSAENGFGNAWLLSGMSGEVVSGLTYSGVESSGNALKINGNAGYLFRGQESGFTTGTYYISYLFYRSVVEGWNLNLKTSSALSTGPNSSTKVLATFDSNPAGRARLKTGSNGTVAVAGADAPYFTFGTTNIAVIKLEITDTSTTASMNIYSGGAPVPADITSWAMTSTDLVTGGAGWRLTLVGESDLIIDEFKIGTELIDVIPEPATIGLIGVGAVSAILARRRIVR